MITRASIYFILLMLFGCEPQMTDDPIPWQAFPEINLNLSLPENTALRIDQGLKEVNSGGVRGIIVYRINSTTFRAYERNCSFQPNQAGATINIHSSKLYFVDDSCGSTFSLSEGVPTGGPAWRPLRQYRTVFSNNTLTITDEAVN